MISRYLIIILISLSILVLAAVSTVPRQAMEFNLIYKEF